MAARAFVRSLNILLKFARMYDFGHPRTARQFDTAWNELRAALSSDNEAGLLLAVSGDQLLLDGTPLESSAAEKSFARMLSSAGIASIHFAPIVTQASLAHLVKAFPTSGGTKPNQLAEQLKAALRNDPAIHVNEVCFVPADSAAAKSTIAAQLAARTMGMGSKQQDELFNNPEKLLQLIMAAEGTKGNSGAAGRNESYNERDGVAPSRLESIDGAGDATSGGNVSGRGDGSDTESGVPGAIPPSRWVNATAGIRRSRQAQAGSMVVETGLMALQEDELQGILQVLAQIARAREDSNDRLDAASFQSRLSTLPRRARFTVSQALSALAAQAPTQSAEKPMLLRLAEHVAVGFALESYERGDIQVNAVRQMLSDMSTELDGLRKIVGMYEQKMMDAGIEVPSHLDALAQQFWSYISEEKRQAALESDDAWCVPPSHVREHIEGLVSRGETESAENILRNYARGITRESAEVRRQTAMGIADLAAVYANSEEKLFLDTIRLIGVQLADEQDSELQSLLGAAFVRMSQEAASKRSYRAIQRAVEIVDYVESERPGVGKHLRPRIAVEDRLPEFIEEALKSGEVPSGLRDVLRRLPCPAAEHIAAKFSRAGFREDCELLVSMLQALGTQGLEHLRLRLCHGSPHEATDTVGILACMDPDTLDRELPERMREWKRTTHDRVVRQISASGAPERGRLLLDVFDYVDPLIRPLAVDEIGMSGEQAAAALLLRIAEGNLPHGSAKYLQLKAMEALSRLRTTAAEAILRRTAEARKAWRWANPSELRLVALQAMEKIDPEWVRYFMPNSGLSIAEFSIEILDIDPNASAIRQRRYPRLRLDRPVLATILNFRENYRIEIPEMTLGGGVAICEQSLHPGSIVDLRLHPSNRSVRVQTIVRDANTQARAFEVVDIELEDRARLRKLLLQLGNAQRKTTSHERSRGPRALLTTNPLD
jgi:hypothetical protein